ncbi:MAG: ATP-binding protein [Algisphaera sp.]
MPDTADTSAADEIRPQLEADTIPVPAPASAPAAAEAAEATPALPSPKFFRQLAGIVNAGQSRSVILGGEIHDLFFAPDGAAKESGEGTYVPLVDFVCERSKVAGLLVMVYELNGPIRLMSAGGDGKASGWDVIKRAWISWKSGVDSDELILRALTDKNAEKRQKEMEDDFDRHVGDVVGRPTLALEFLRQLTLCSRSKRPDGSAYLPEQLLILIEGADMILPAGNGDIGASSATDRHRVAIVQDWFSDPGFMNARDTVVMLADSASLIHPRVSKLPSVLHIGVDAPKIEQRRHYIDRFLAGKEPGGVAGQTVELWAGPEALAKFSAGLSIHALRRVLIEAAHRGTPLTPEDVVGQVEAFISHQLGDDVVEFKKPSHTLDDVVGASRLKAFFETELIPRFKSEGDDALPGAAVAGPIGGGKTFIFEALAGALDLPVLVLKNLRSQWFGQTDVIFEKLRRVLESLGKVLIFVDEADTQFGKVDGEGHATEKRLTGKVQQMMSDPALRGKVIWLLMTARIHRLSPDIRRPGRVGDLIIPVLDPPLLSQDRTDFLKWALKPALGDPIDEDLLSLLDTAIDNTSAAGFAALRSRLKSETAAGRISGSDDVLHAIRDQITPDIAETRRYQTLQALVNCTRRSLLPDPKVTAEERAEWMREIRALEAKGVR